MESKLKATQREVDTVEDIMLDNFNKAEERNEKLEDLDERATVLLNESQSFKKTVKEAKQKNQRASLRSKAGLIAIVTVLALVIITIVAVMLSNNNSSDTSVDMVAVTSVPHISKQS